MAGDIFLSIVCVVGLLYLGRDILQPLAIAIFFSYALRPIVDFLTIPWEECCNKCRGGEGGSGNWKNGGVDYGSMAGGGSRRASPGGGGKRRKAWRCPRSFAVVIALLMALGILVGAALLMAESIQSFQNEDLDSYEDEALKLRDKALQWASKFGVNLNGTALVDVLQSKRSPIPKVFGSVLLFLVNFVVDLGVILLFVVYLLFETTIRAKRNSLRYRIDEQIQHYITRKTLISFVVAFFVFIILWLLQVRMAVAFACVTFLFNFIPNVGPLIATLLPLPVILFDPYLHAWQRVCAMAFPVVFHLVVGNVVEPWVFGKKFEMHPIFLLTSLAFWYGIWGASGAILSVPMTAVWRIMLTYSYNPYAKLALQLMEGDVSSVLDYHERDGDGDDDDDDDEDEEDDEDPAGDDYERLTEKTK